MSQTHIPLFSDLTERKDISFPGCARAHTHLSSGQEYDCPVLSPVGFRGTGYSGWLGYGQVTACAWGWGEIKFQLRRGSQPVQARFPAFPLLFAPAPLPFQEYLLLWRRVSGSDSLTSVVCLQVSGSAPDTQRCAGELLFGCRSPSFAFCFLSTLLGGWAVGLHVNGVSATGPVGLCRSAQLTLPPCQYTAGSV